MCSIRKKDCDCAWKALICARVVHFGGPVRGKSRSAHKIFRCCDDVLLKGPSAVRSELTQFRRAAFVLDGPLLRNSQL